MSVATTDVAAGLEVHWANVGDLRLRLGLAPPLAEGRSLLLLQGRSEFLEKYEDVYDDLRARGFRVATLDWRGQGGSDRLLTDRRRGYVADFRDYVADLDQLVALASTHLPRPWYALAHSMGGLILLEALAARPALVERAVLAAPLLGIRVPRMLQPIAPAIASTVCRLGFTRRYVPGHDDEPAAGDDPEGNVLTSDHDRFRLYRQRCRAQRDLLVGGVTWGWLRAALAAIVRLNRSGTLETVNTPLLVLVAGNERVVDPAAIAWALQRLPDARAERFAGAEHELLMERDAIRDEVLKLVDAYLR